MSKLVDKERLAKLAKALNDRMKAAVKAEADRAVAAESRIEGKADLNTAAIAAINNEENGLLKQAKNYADSVATELDKRIQTKVSTSEYEAKVTELENKDKDMAEDILGLDTAVKGIEERLGDGDLNLPAIDEAIKNFQEQQQGIDAKQNQDIVKAQEAANKAQGEVDALEGVVDALDERVVEAENFIKGHSHAEIEADIQALEGKVEDLEGFVEDHDHKPMEDRIAALEEMHSEGGDVDQKIQAVQGDVDALEKAYTKFIGEQAAKDQAQDGEIAKKADKAAYEAKVEELVAKDAELDKAIKDEAARAAGVEQGLQQAIDAINDAEDGILAQAKELVNAEKDLRVEADTALDNRLKAVENSVGQGGALEARVKANEDKLAGLEEGCTTVQAAIDKAEADAKAHAEAKIAELVDSAPEAMDTLNELAKAINDNKGVYDSYVEQHAQAMAKQKEDLQKEIDDDIAAARTLISAEIDADVKEEADRAKLEEQAIRTDFAAADAALKLELQAEIDADVKVEKERAEGQEAAIRQELAAEATRVDNKIAADIAAESAARVAVENKIREDFEAADEAMDGRLTVVENMLAGGGEEGGFADVVARLANAEEDIVNLEKEDVRLNGEIAKKVDQGAYNAKVEALEGEDERIAGLVQKAQDEVDAVEGRMNTAEGKIATLEGFVKGHDHSVMEQGIADNKKGVASNKAAIEVLNGDATKEGSVAKSIADALKPYATEAETLAVIGQVVNSLALTMEGNKMVLKLGGVEGVTIHSTSLDMVTDADIDEIVAGLDEANPTNLF